MTADVFAARLTLLILLSIALLGILGVGLYWLISFLWREWQIYWHGSRTHLNRLQKFRDLWPQQPAANTNLPSGNGHSSTEQSRRVHWRAKVLEKLSGRQAGASGQGFWQGSVIEPPRPAVTTNSHQHVGHMV